MNCDCLSLSIVSLSQVEEEDSLKTSLQSLAVSLSGPSTKEQVHASNAVQRAIKKATGIDLFHFSFAFSS